MSLQVVGEFNKLSDKMLATVKPLNPGQKAIFRLLNGQKDPATGELFFGGAQTINCKDRIVDIGTGRPVDIGVVTGISVDNKVTAWKKHNLTGGGANGLVGEKFELHGSSVDDLELYYFLCLSNECKSNKNRNSRIPARYELVNETAEAKRGGYKRSDLTKALLKAESMKNNEVVSFAAGMGWDETKDIELLRDDVGAYAQAYPVEFLAKVTDGVQAYKSTLKLAISKGVIVFDPISFKFKWAESGAVVAKLERDGDKDELTLLAEFVLHTKNGLNIYESIKNQYESIVAQERDGIQTQATVVNEEEDAFSEPAPTPEIKEPVIEEKPKTGGRGGAKKVKEEKPVEPVDGSASGGEDGAFEL